MISKNRLQGTSISFISLFGLGCGKSYAPAVYDSVSAEISNGDYLFKASGSKLKFDGYLRVYNNSGDEDKEKMLPHIEVGDALDLVELLSEQKFYSATSRFSEATLVRILRKRI